MNLAICWSDMGASLTSFHLRRSSARVTSRSAASSVSLACDLPGFRDFGILKERPERLDRGQRHAVHWPVGRDVRVGEPVNALDGVVEVGVDLVAVKVAHDQQRRVAQGLAVELELAVGLAEVDVKPLVLPREAPAAATRRRNRAAPVSFFSLFSNVKKSPLGSASAGFGSLDQTAYVEEVFLRGRTLTQPGATPFLGKVVWVHCLNNLHFTSSSQNGVHRLSSLHLPTRGGDRRRHHSDRSDVQEDR